ncbi:hypothetical protein [Streptacidiphilus sp. MAP5-52]|uniref:hypothetical protein n=1 Tax=Streptacidiphilus sp. MAP5-52 TaxID=3156267 RepID=UPI00351709E2
MSVIGQDEGIEHGTTKGYGQHTYRKVPATEACGCLKAVREARAAKAEQAAQRNGTKAGAQHTARGHNFVQHDGMPRASRVVQAPGGCPEPDCGQEAGTDTLPLPRGWVRVVVSGSTEPVRTFCSGSCAAFGVALAELRMAVSA